MPRLLAIANETQWVNAEHEQLVGHRIFVKQIISTHMFDIHNLKIQCRKSIIEL